MGLQHWWIKWWPLELKRQRIWYSLCCFQLSSLKKKKKKLWTEFVLSILLQLHRKNNTLTTSQLAWQAMEFPFAFCYKWICVWVWGLSAKCTPILLPVGYNHHWVQNWRDSSARGVSPISDFSWLLISQVHRVLNICLVK